MRKKTMTARAVATTVALALLAGCAGTGGGDGDSGEDSSPGKVVYTGWGGAGQEAVTEAWFEEFTAETGIEVVQDYPVSAEKVKLMVDNNKVTWDILQFDPGMTGGVVDNPLLEKIDCTVVACDDFSGEMKAYPQAVPVLTYSMAVTYNTDTFPNPASAPQNYADFFNVSKFPGLRMVTFATEGWRGLLEAALVVDGVPREKLYPLDVDRALKSLAPIKDSLIVLADDAECVTNVASGEAVMGMCYNGRAATAKKDALPIGIGWGQQILMANHLMIVKDSPNYENAQKLIAWASSAENNGKLGNFIAYGSTNPKATFSKDSPFAEFLPSANVGTGDDAPIVIDDSWWSENKEATISKVLAFVQG